MPVDMLAAIKVEMPDAGHNEKLAEIWARMHWLKGEDKLHCFEMICATFARERSERYN